MSIKLKDRREIAAGTMAFHFEKPAGFTFISGQCGEFTLIDAPQTDTEGNVRAFSLASAPHEKDLMIATRMRDSAFKRSLAIIPCGTELTMDAPWGDLVLHEDRKIPAVFLTGGIGITPVRSIVLQAAHDMLAQQFFLFYSNRTPEDAVFVEDLLEAQKQNQNFTFVPTMTQIDKSSTPWHGETGVIDKDMLTKFIGDLTVPIYYITGPEGLVAAMRKMLGEAGVKTSNIRTEEFSGY